MSDLEEVDDRIRKLVWEDLLHQLTYFDSTMSIDRLKDALALVRNARKYGGNLSLNLDIKLD